MSRAINIDAPEADIVASCAKKRLTISAIETLRSGGTRVVMNNADDAAIVAKQFRAKIIAGDVTRASIRVGRL